MKLRQLMERRRQTDTYYHGTSSKFLRSIMVNGLVTNPKKRVYGAKNYLQSFEGVYITDVISYAMARASHATYEIGGKPIIIILQISQNYGYVDEDFIKQFIIWYFRNSRFKDFVKHTVSASADLNDNNGYEKDFADFLDDFQLLLSINPTIYDLLFENMFDEFEQYFHVSGNGKELFRGLFDIIFEYTSDVDEYSITNSIDRNLEDFREILEQLTKIVKLRNGDVNPLSGQVLGDFGQSKRIPNRIGFRGKNRIKSIILLDEDGVVEKVLYGEPVDFEYVDF